MDELTLNGLDYNWVDECDDTRLLKKGLKMLKEDGSHYPDLEKYIDDKLKKIDKKYR